MLFLEDGREIGLLSGGCLERDLADKAKNVMSTNRSQTVFYDTSAEDDLSWGQGLGCNGMIQILLEPVDLWMREQLLKLKSYLDQGISVVSFRKLNADYQMSQLVLYHTLEMPLAIWMKAAFFKVN